jgi:type VI secretion system protein ImpH
MTAAGQPGAAGPGGRHASPVAGLLAVPQRFGFHQAVRLLQRWLGRPEGQAAGARLRYRNSLSLAFPASEIAQLQVQRTAQGEQAAQAPVASADGVDRIELTPAFMGLLGAGGALPLFYTEMFAGREEPPHRDAAARGFLDIFQHRAVSLFHEAWRKHRLPLQYERDGDARFLPLALSLAGVGPSALRGRLAGADGAVADHALAYFAGALQQRHLGATQLQGLLAHYFDVPVRVASFVGRWFTLSEGSRTVLGGANACLGAAAVVGERVWQRDLRLRVTLGPLDAPDLRRFLPGAPGARALRELLTLFTGVSLEYEVRLLARAQAVTTVQLGGHADTAARLGWNSFVQSGPSPCDRSEAGYDIHAVPA